jgi:RNA polymerase sigma-70 factor (ECF subfamily)
VSLALFGDALDASLESARRTNPGLADRSPQEKYLRGLHLEDLALACACAAGHEPAWEHFIRELRPVLYRAADALDSSGRARELADSIYADLYGTEEREGKRKSLFRYFHGRSSLATWLRAVLAQRHVDAIRAHRRFDEMPDEEPPDQSPSAEPPNPDRARFLELFHRALAAVVAALVPRERLRLALYYGQDLTLAQIGRITGEHEATVSRQLAKTRRGIRVAVAERLRSDEGLGEAQVEECFQCAVEDPGAMDLGDILRKNSSSERSKSELP